jgi:glycosyltransferase involved in cell wall biosynthesis
MARQAGIDIASGEYSIHVDPDDWIERTMLEELYLKATELDADMVICDLMIDFPNHSYCAPQRIRKCKPSYCLNRMMYGRMHGSLCNKLIRTSLYNRYNIRFFEGINYCEDYLTCAQLFLRRIKIAYIPKPFYHYDQAINVNSATRRYTKDTLRTQFLFFNKLCDILEGRKKRALCHVISVIAFDSYYYNILSAREFVIFFGKYRRRFLKSNYKFKRRMALYLAACGLMKYAKKLVTIE